MGPVGAVVHVLAVALSGLTDSKSCIQADGIRGRSIKTGKHPAHDASSVNAQMHVVMVVRGAMGSCSMLFRCNRSVLLFVLLFCASGRLSKRCSFLLSTSVIVWTCDACWFKAKMEFWFVDLKV